MATGEIEEDVARAAPKRAKGGKARAKVLSPEQRSEIARTAASSTLEEKRALGRLLVLAWRIAPQLNVERNIHGELNWLFRWMVRVPVILVVRKHDDVATICSRVPSKLVKAPASGTPVIASRRGSIPELIDDGVYRLHGHRSAKSTAPLPRGASMRKFNTFADCAWPHALTPANSLQVSRLLSAVHGPKIVLGMLVTVLDVNVVAFHSRFARQLDIPRVVAPRVA